MRRKAPAETATTAPDATTSGIAQRGSHDTVVTRGVRLPLGRDDEVAAGVHEVQNALFAVLGWVEIARGSRDSALRDKALRIIESGVHRARSQLATLADPAERFRVHDGAFHVAPLVSEAYELLHPRAASVGVIVTAEPGDTSVVAMGDDGRVMQILTNLVLNAVDAIHALPARERGRGRVEVGVQCDAHEVLLTVQDDGVGMDDATRARAFDPFFTTHGDARGTRKKGTGLGLAICRALAEAMHGRLVLRSEPGAGTQVTLALPRGHDDAVVSTRSIESLPVVHDEHGLRAGTRVLVIDDEPAIRELLEVALTLRGAAVTAAATLVEARHALAHHAFDVVLVDEALGPHDSGAALVVDLARTMPEITRVLMTGAPSVDHLPAEACRWLLRKPFSLDEAVRVIASALDR